MGIIRIFIITLLASSLLQGAAFEKTAKFRNVNVVLSSPKPLVVGNNDMTFKVSKEGQSLDAVKISVKAFMPAMPGMPAMQDKSDAKALGEGHYKSTINFSMGGTWQIHIYITPKEGKKMRVKTSINL